MHFQGSRKWSLRSGCTPFLLLLALTASASLAAAGPETATAETAGAALSANALTSHAAATGEVLHLVVGHSMFIDAQTRLRHVYVGNPAVLGSIAATPYRIAITAKAPGVSNLLLTDERGRSQVYLVRSDLDVTGLQADLDATFPGGHLRADADEGRVSVYGTVASDADAGAVLKLASLYSKDVANSLSVDPRRVQQVRLKVRMVEIDRSKLNQAGVNLFSGGKNIGAASSGQFPVTTSITSPAGSSGSSAFSISDPLNLLFYNTNVNVGAAIKDLENRNILQILAEPNITTISGEKASFLSGGEFPFPVVQPSANGPAAVTIQFRPYGVKLDFTPVVNPDGTIRLTVAPEVSALDYTNAVTVAGFTIPALSTRRAETQVVLRDGQSFAISGLLDHRTTDSLGQVPGLGELPILGPLFRSKSINHSTVELVVIVTPAVIDPAASTMKPQEPKLPIPPLDTLPFDKKMMKSESGPVEIPADTQP